MSVDIASLVYEIDATQVTKAEDALDRLTAAADRVDSSARKVKSATELAGIGQSSLADGTQRATRSATEMADAQGAVERASRSAAAASADVRAQRALEAAAMRELVAATKAYERDQAAAAKAVAAAQAAADREAQQSAQQTFNFRVRMAKQRAAEEAATVKAAADAQAAADRAAEQSAAQVLAFRQRMAKQRAAEEAATVKEAQAAQEAADRAAEKSASDVLAFRVRMSKQRAAEEAAAVKAAAAAQDAADREAERSAQQVLAFRVRMAQQRAAEEAATARAQAQAEADAARDQAAAVAALEARVHALKSAIDPTYAAQARLDAEMREASDLYKLGAISASDYAARVSQLDAQMAAAARGQTTMATAHAKGAAGAKLQANELANLSFQLNDVIVGLVSGQKPLTVAVQQGSQIGQVFQMAAARGVGFGAALRSIGAVVGGLLLQFAPLIAIAAAIGSAFLIGAQQINKSAGDITKGMGLTEAQMDRLKAKGTDLKVTFGDTFKATFQVLGGEIAKALHLDEATKAIGDFYQKAVDWTYKAVKAILGAFAGAVAAIGASWKLLPGVIGDATISAANLLISGVNKMVQLAVAGLNVLIEKANAAAKAVGLAVQLPSLGAAPQFGQLANPFAGAASSAGGALKAAYDKGNAAAQQWVDDTASKIADQAVKNARARILKEAGKPGKTHAGPADDSAQRGAQIDAQIAQAQQDELNAAMGLAHSIEERAQIQRQLAAAALAEKQAQIDREEAQIEADKGIDGPTKARLKDQLEIVRLMDINVAQIKQAVDDQNEASEIAKRTLDHKVAEEQAAIDLLQSQQALAKSEAQRTAISLQILAHQQEQERLELQAQVDDAKLDDDKRDAARKELAERKIVWENEKKAAYNMDVAYQQVSGALGDMKDAFKQHDWQRGFSALASAVDALALAMRTGGDQLLGALSGLAGAIGGKVGRALGAITGALQLGQSLGGLANAGGIGGIMSDAGGIAGGLGLFGSLAGSGIQGLAGGLLTSIPGLGGFMASGVAGAAGIAGGTTGLLGGLGVALASNPAGWLIGGGLLLGSLLGLGGGKPTNAGAGYDLTTGALSGNKRTADTEKFVTQAGQTIKLDEDSLKALGIQLGTTINGLVIGTRDQSQIYTSTGQTLYSATGDGDAAVAAAMKAVLQGATYVNDAQKKLVDDMLAAGKGFDDISQALQDWQNTLTQAQGLSQSLSDQILQLTNPQQYDLTMQQRATDALVAQINDYVSGGFLPADQQQALLDQAKQLNDLQVAAIVKKYADAQTAAAQAANDAASAASETIGKWEDIAKSLDDYRASLAAQAAGAVGPLAAYRQAKAALDALRPGVAAGDPTALGQIQSVGDAYIAARKNVAVGGLDVQQAIADVAALAGQGADYARTQSGDIQKQIADNTAQMANTISQLQQAIEQLTADNAKLLARVAEAAEGTEGVLTRVSQDGTSFTTKAA